MSVTSVLGHGEQLNDMELISKDINTKIAVAKGLDQVKILKNKCCGKKRSEKMSSRSCLFRPFPRIW